MNNLRMLDATIAITLVYILYNSIWTELFSPKTGENWKKRKKQDAWRVDSPQFAIGVSPSPLRSEG